MVYLSYCLFGFMVRGFVCVSCCCFFVTSAVFGMCCSMIVSMMFVRYGLSSSLR